MKLVAANDNVIVKIEKMDKNQKTDSGIVIVSNPMNEVKQDRGIVYGVGKGRVAFDGSFIKPQVQEGDDIIFNQFAGTEISVGDDSFLVLKETDIIAIVK